MLIEGECGTLGPRQAAETFGVSKPRDYQMRKAFRLHGAKALARKNRGPKRHYRRTQEVTRQVIRHRFLDPDATAEVIAQKIRQTGLKLSTRSVEGSVAKFDFWGKIQKSSIRNSMSYRLSNSRKSNFATEPQIVLLYQHQRQQPVGVGIKALLRAA